MKAIAIAFQYLPFVLQGVQSVESALSTAPGETKKQAVLAALQAGAQTGEAVPEEHVATIAKLIDTTVAALNATGWFKKAAAK